MQVFLQKIMMCWSEKHLSPFRFGYFDKDPLDTSPFDWFDNVFDGFDDVLKNGFSDWFLDAYAVLERIGFGLLIVAGFVQLVKIASLKNKAPWQNDLFSFVAGVFFKALVLGGMPWLISKVISICEILREAL